MPSLEELELLTRENEISTGQIEQRNQLMKNSGFTEDKVEGEEFDPFKAEAEREAENKLTSE